MQNKLPQGWTECELGDVCNLDNGSKIYNVNLPLLDVKYLRGKKEASIAKQGVLLNNGDFVILVDGENSGEIFSIYEQGVMGSTFKKLIFSDYVNVDFVKFKIKSKQKMFKLHKVGSAIPHLNKKLFKTIQLLLPPLNEQKRIAEKIESEFKKIDEGLEHLEKAKEQIKQYRQSVLKFAFEGKLYKVSEWKETILNDISNKISDGSHNPPSRQQSGIPMLSGQNIKNSQIIFDNFRYISEKDYNKEYQRTPIEEGDVLLTIVGTIGESAVVPVNIQKFVLQRSVALIKPNNINSKFLKYYFDSPISKYYFKTKERGTAQKGIYLNTLKNLPVLLPSIEEQKKIVKEIEKRFAVADEVEKVVEDNIEKAKQLKQSILKKAFEGRLVPQDPKDELASILLEKIKQEREKK